MEYTREWLSKVLEILEQKTSINSETGCWEWTGLKKSDDGYGRVTIDGELYYIHRLSAMIFHGYRPEYKNLNVLHRCNVRHCWNRDHVYVGTHEDNMQDKSKSITHCPNGHEYNEENTYNYQKPDGRWQRMCRECRKTRTAASNEKRRLLKFGKVG